MHLSGETPVQASHPSGHLVIVAMSKKYFGEATIQSAKVFPKQTAQLVMHGKLVELVVLLDKIAVDGKYFPHPSIGTQSKNEADLQVLQYSVL